MTKQEFIALLTQALKEESYETVVQSVSYYEEMIDDLMENGYSEKEAIGKLGKLEDIVAQIKESDEIIEMKPIQKSHSIVLIIALVLTFPLWGSLLATFLILLLCAYICIWLIPLIAISLAIVGIVCFIVGIFGTFPLFVKSIALGMTQLGVSAIFGSLAMLGIWLTMKTYHVITQKSIQLAKWTKNIFILMLRKVGYVC